MKYWVFWLNIAENYVYLWYGYCSKLFGNLRKESEFDNGVAKILTKVWERKDKWCDGRREKKFWISIISLLKFLLPNPLPARINARSAGWSARKGNQLWQPSRRNCRGVRREIIRIVTTKLSKMRGKKRKERERERERELWQSSCWKLGGEI